MDKTTAFTSPSQANAEETAALAARGELFDGLGRRKIVTPETAGAEKHKLVGYTRATTFIGALEDQTVLHKWKTRLILEGAADADLENAAMTAYQRLLESEGDENEEAAGKIYRKELDEIADRAFSYAGGRDKADYGTALHRLVELYHDDDVEGLREESADLAERWGAGILSDLAAYRDEWGRLQARTGASVVRQECLVVDDDRKIAGRADLVWKMRLAGDKRARNILADVKTGKVDNKLKLAQQLAMYAGSKLYDPETGERSPLRVRQDVAIVIHVPKGEARAEMILVDLEPGRRANRLCEKVRASRRKQPGMSRPLDEMLEA